MKEKESLSPWDLPKLGAPPVVEAPLGDAQGIAEVFLEEPAEGFLEEVAREEETAAADAAAFLAEPTSEAVVVEKSFTERLRERSKPETKARRPGWFQHGGSSIGRFPRKKKRSPRINPNSDVAEIERALESDKPRRMSKVCADCGLEKEDNNQNFRWTPRGSAYRCVACEAKAAKQLTPEQKRKNKEFWKRFRKAEATAPALDNMGKTNRDRLETNRDRLETNRDK